MYNWLTWTDMHKNIYLNPSLNNEIPWGCDVISLFSGPRCWLCYPVPHWPRTVMLNLVRLVSVFSENKTPDAAQMSLLKDKSCTASAFCWNAVCLLTPSASSITGTGEDFRLVTTSLSPTLLALTMYWSDCCEGIQSGACVLQNPLESWTILRFKKKKKKKKLDHRRKNTGQLQYKVLQNACFQIYYSNPTKICYLVYYYTNDALQITFLLNVV